MSKINIDDLANAINQELLNYNEEIEESVLIAADITSKELLNNIIEDSPVETGDYKKGWKRRRTKQVFTVQNTTHPERTAVLEHGHIGKNGKRVGVRPHIMKNGENAKDKFVDLCIDIVADGLRLKK